MQIQMHRRRRLLIKERNSLFLGQSDQGPTQLEFALLQKQETIGPKHVLNHLVVHQYHSPTPKKVLLKNFERTGSIRKPSKEKLFQLANFILLISNLGMQTVS